MTILLNKAGLTRAKAGYTNYNGNFHNHPQVQTRPGFHVDGHKFCSRFKRDASVFLYIQLRLFTPYNIDIITDLNITSLLLNKTSVATKTMNLMWPNHRTIYGHKSTGC